MSRVGLSPITVPQEVKVEIKGTEVTVEGSKGKLSRSFHPDMTIVLKDGILTVTRPSDNKTHRSLHGLTRSLLANMVQGVTNGFEKMLEINGIGYKVQKIDNGLSLQIGFNRPKEFQLPNGIEAAIEGKGNNMIKLTGIDKEQVGEVAAKIRALRPADPYKGKGIKYAGEVLHLKPGKAGKAAQKG